MYTLIFIYFLCRRCPNETDVMTQAREPLSIMDGNPPNCDFSTKAKRGIFLSKSLALVVLTVFVLALIATSLTVYNFAACPHTDTLANVTKYELTHCDHDHDKVHVLPLSTEHSRSVLPIDSTTNPPFEEETTLVKDVRLPTDIRPDRYYLKLTPYIYEGNFTFDGECSVIVNVTNDTNKVTFHGVELTFHKIKLFALADRKPVTIIRRTEDLPRQFHILILGETLKRGEQYILNITYTGVLNDNLHGFYRSSYEEKGVKRLV